MTEYKTLSETESLLKSYASGDFNGEMFHLAQRDGPSISLKREFGTVFFSLAGTADYPVSPVTALWHPGVQTLSIYDRGGKRQKIVKDVVITDEEGQPLVDWADIQRRNELTAQRR